MTGLVYIGKIVELNPIPDANRIVSATVVCGQGGKWRGVVQKNSFSLFSKCKVYLPDSVIPQCDNMSFMESSQWRVKLRRFKGTPSEVVIMPIEPDMQALDIGQDITAECGVTKYFKPVPANLQGRALGPFPGFIPKTDEPNYQRNPDLVEALHGRPYYIAEKADGSSTTAYKYKGHFGICSRNWELVPDIKIGYWEIAAKYKLEEKLPEGIALQWETCGPKIQGNPMGLKEIDGFAFSAYDIINGKYLPMTELKSLCCKLDFPMVKIEEIGESFDKSRVDTLGEGTYANNLHREGVVVRSLNNIQHAPISFKVINLNYES